MVRYAFFVAVWAVTAVNSYAQAHDGDSTACDTCAVNPAALVPASAPLDTTDQQRDPLFSLTPQYYREHFGAETLLDKITDNWGKGCESLYGTRNLRPILHGAAYRGGANNYFHRDGRRKNQNPLPQDGIRNLCEEGFSNSVYLYRNNWDNAPTVDTCDCVNNEQKVMRYHQLDYFDDAHVYQMLKMVHTSIVDENVGPVYLHCWNGWHASGYLSAVILRQYCKFSARDAVNYWDLGTDGMNKSPRYQTQRDRIKKFVPYADLVISDSLSECLCPDMPDDIDSSQLHIDLDYLVMVPEAVPVGTTIPLSNIKFKSGSSTISSMARARPDLEKVIKAMTDHPNMVLEVGGHTDKSGSTSKNYSISRQRAKRVYDYFVSKGIPAARLSHKGYGPSQPVASNKYKSTRAQNRRIEVKLISKGKEDFNKLVEEAGNDSVVYREPPKITPKEEEVRTNSGNNTIRPNNSNSHVSSSGAGSSSDLKELVDNAAEFNAGDIFLLPGIKFDPYKTSLKDKNNADLKLILQALKANAGLNMEIGGFTDNTGNAAKNKELSRARAKSVYKFLLEKGISADQITYKGYGASNPRFSNKTREGRDKNRRIEVKVITHAEVQDFLKSKDAPGKVYTRTLSNLVSHAAEFKAGDRFVLERLEFAPYKTDIRDKNNADLKLLLNAMKENPKLKLEVGGYTDNSGRVEANESISAARAKSVYSYLINAGISKSRLTYKGYGPKHPRHSNKTREGRDKNRRIEVKIL